MSAAKKQHAEHAPETTSLGAVLDRHERYLSGQMTYEQLHGLEKNDNAKQDTSGSSEEPRTKK